MYTDERATAEPATGEQPGEDADDVGEPGIGGSLHAARQLPKNAILFLCLSLRLSPPPPSRSGFSPPPASPPCRPLIPPPTHLEQQFEFEEAGRVVDLALVDRRVSSVREVVNDTRNRPFPSGDGRLDCCLEPDILSTRRERCLAVPAAGVPASSQASERPSASGAVASAPAWPPRRQPRRCRRRLACRGGVGRTPMGAVRFPPSFAEPPPRRGRYHGGHQANGSSRFGRRPRIILRPEGVSRPRSLFV